MDIVLESLRVVILIGLIAFLLYRARHRFGPAQSGWNLIVAGFALLLFGSLLDLSDNFPALRPLIVVGDTQIQSILEKVAGYLGGFLLLALGLIRWIPSVQALSSEIARRTEADEALIAARNSLEHRIVERTAELENEIAERTVAEDALRQNEATLQRQIVDLEEAQLALERQGADLVRLAQDLCQARDEAESASLAKSQFLANMSHELRTPLNAIIGFSEMLKDEVLGPLSNARYKGYAEDIRASGHHLLNLINDILDLSKVEAGSDELHEEEVDLPDVTGQALKLVKILARKSGISIEALVPGDLPPLRADRRKLTQVLVNLLSNAVKFTPANGKVGLKVWCQPDTGLVIQITDTGIGIAPKDIPKALSTFGQVDAGINRKHKGTGLGLPLAKSLVELHGGVLDLQSQVGVGTTVTLRFPAYRIVTALNVASSNAPDTSQTA